jgi:hypothetical protein
MNGVSGHWRSDGDDHQRQFPGWVMALFAFCFLHKLQEALDAQWSA